VLVHKRIVNLKNQLPAAKPFRPWEFIVPFLGNVVADLNPGKVLGAVAQSHGSRALGWAIVQPILDSQIPEDKRVCGSTHGLKPFAE
jgi:hypothetical protein